MTRGELVTQLRSLGIVPGDVLLVHASFRAVRPVEGGPAGLIDALRDAVGADGTLVMPSWTGDDEAVFDPASTPASPDLGIVPDTFWRLEGVQRSTHPFAFAAAGAQAASILRDPLPLPPHIPASPVGRVHELDGRILLLGVDHEVNTTLHLAEIVAEVPYRVRKAITVRERGMPKRIEYGENDHCTRRFALMGGWLDARGLQATGQVGQATTHLARARDVVDLAVERLERDPLAFLHPRGACPDCDEAHRSLD